MKLFSLIALGAVCSAVVPAAVITFDSFLGFNTQNPRSFPLRFDSPDTGRVYAWSDVVNGNGTPALRVGFGTLGMRTLGGSFDLHGFEAAISEGNNDPSAEVTLTAYFRRGGTTSLPLTLTQSLQTFSFDSLVGLTAVFITGLPDQGSGAPADYPGYFIVDNINATGYQPPDDSLDFTEFLYFEGPTDEPNVYGFRFYSTDGGVVNVWYDNPNGNGSAALTVGYGTLTFDYEDGSAFDLHEFDAAITWSNDDPESEVTLTAFFADGGKKSFPLVLTQSMRPYVLGLRNVRKVEITPLQDLGSDGPDEGYPGFFLIDNLRIALHTPGGSDVPEPGTLALLAAGLTAMAARRRR